MFYLRLGGNHLFCEMNDNKYQSVLNISRQNKFPLSLNVLSLLIPNICVFMESKVFRQTLDFILDPYKSVFHYRHPDIEVHYIIAEREGVVKLQEPRSENLAN